jgi:hypothetical protein
MKKIFAILIGTMIASSAALATEEKCFQVSVKADAWSREPESLCLQTNKENQYVITLKTGLPFDEQEVARFNMTLMQQSRCLDCNRNVYGIANPSNSAFNGLAIRFNGKVERQTGTERGTVSIGETKLYYRTYN